MSLRPHLRGPHSLRARLLVGMVTLAALCLIVLAATLYLQQRQFMLNRLDEQATAARRAADRFLTFQGIPGGTSTPRTRSPATGGYDPAFGPPPRDIGQPQLPDGTFVQRRSAGGTVLGSETISYDTEHASPPRLPADLHAGQQLTVAAQSGDGRYRVSVGTNAAGSIVIGAVPFGGVTSTLNRLLLAIVLLVGSALAAMALFGWWLIGVGLRPLHAIAGTAGKIASGDLSERVARDDDRTEVGRLGRALNAMLVQIERAFTRQRQSEEQLRRFIADASHELRTPLSAIRGYAELHRLGAARDPAAVEHAMGRIESETTRMGALVEDLLTLARLDETREPVREPVVLSDLAADAVADARVADQTDRQITLVDDTGGAEPIVTGDEAQLRQVIANLVRNALVHTPDGSPIEIGLAVDRARSIAELSVRDHGPGLPVDDGAVLFERFWRAAPGRERGPAGAGLGLAIVAGIVGGHGGEVSAEPAPGGGALFRVRLPIVGDL